MLAAGSSHAVHDRALTGAALDRLGERAHISVSLVGDPGETAREHATQRLERGLERAARGDECEQRVGAEIGGRPATVDALDERETERELIGARVGGQAEALLGSHVRGRARDMTANGDLRIERGDIRDPGRRRGGAHREAEIGDAHAAIGAEQEVRGLHVAMHETGGVGGGEPARGLGVEPSEPTPVGGGAASARERVAGDELGREEHVAVGEADIVDGEHVGMLEPGERAGLAEQALALAAVVGAVGAHELDRDIAAQRGIPRGPDLAHPAGGDPAIELVAADHARGRGAQCAELRDHRGAALAAIEVLLDRRERRIRERALDEAHEVVLARAAGGHDARGIRTVGARRQSQSTELRDAC